MKTSLFNFNRIGLLLQRYFTERFRTELIYWSIMIIAFMFIRNIIPAAMGLIFVAGAFYASRFFREIHSPGNGIAYFMIPATQLEKMTVSIIMTSFYYFVMMMIVYSIGNLLGTFLNNLFVSIDFLRGFLNIFGYNPSYSPLKWILFEFYGGSFALDMLQSLFMIFTYFLFYQSIFLFGSIYFKNNQAFKTLLVMIIIVIFVSILFLLILKLITGNTFIGSENTNTTIYKIYEKIFLYLLPPFFWVVSYFRLTEKQV